MALQALKTQNGASSGNRAMQIIDVSLVKSDNTYNVYSNGNSSFVIVSRDDRFTPVLACADVVGSTAVLLKYAVEHPEQEYILATESGILHEMQAVWLSIQRNHPFADERLFLWRLMRGRCNKTSPILPTKARPMISILQTNSTHCYWRLRNTLAFRIS